MRRIVIASMAVGALAVPTAAAVETGVTEPAVTPLAGHASSGQRLWEPGEVVVRYERGTGASERADARNSIQGDVAQNLEINRAQLLDLPDGTTVRDAASELAADPAVDFAEPNYIYREDAVPSDTFFSALWGLNNTGQTITTPNATGAGTDFPGTADADIDAPEGWDVAPVENGDASKVVVAVTDSGIDYHHPDLAPNMWHNPGEIPGNGIDDDANGFVDDVFGADFKSDFTTTCSNAVPPACADADPIDDSNVNHGTHVAGTIGARGNDGYGVTGVAQTVQLMAVKVFDAKDASSNVSVGNGFAYAAANGAKVVNASLGGPCPSALQAAAIQNNPDVLFVFSAGNGGNDGVGDNNDIVDDTAVEFSAAACGDTSGTSSLRHPGQYPCNFNSGPEAADYTGPAYDFPNVMCVAASTNTDGRAGFSNYGPTSVQIAAPGSQTLSTQPAYKRMLVEGAEDPGFDGRLLDGGSTPITSSTATGFRRIASGLAGSFSLSESNAGVNYAPSSSFSARPAGPVDLTGQIGCHMQWLAEEVNSDTGNNDGILIDRGDAGVFTNLTSISHTSAGPTQQVFAVPELNGKPQASWRIRFVSDGDALVGDGSRIDDVGIFCLGGGYAPDRIGLPLNGTHKFLNGTSMATPHVTGVAALLRSKAPALSPAQVIQRIMTGGDANTAFANPGSTPVESGRRLNLLGALNAGPTPPQPAAPVISGPEGLINNSSPSFTFTTDALGTRTQCSLDGAVFGDCTNAGTFAPATPLADGSHELRVRALGAEGGVSPTSTRSVTVDTAAPDTSITGGPAEGSTTSDNTPAFDLSSTEGGSTFACRLDGAAFAPCAGSFTTGTLTDGAHTLQVQATDAAGNTDGSAATRSFGVDASPAKVAITKGPKKKTTKTKATFEFKASESATFTCQLDKQPAGPCTSPAKVQAKKGKHTFAVTATDAAGNVGKASLSWTVKKKKKRRH